MGGANVLFADSFEKACHALDGTVQRRVLDFMLKLRRDPDAHGLNLKQPRGVRDKRVWTARVNDNFRAVLWRPDRGTFYLVTVKPHDDAYSYAARTVWNVNRITGGVEFHDHGTIEEILGETSGEEPTTPGRGAGFFDEVSNADLARLGVAPALIPVLREIRTEDALLGICEHLPKLAGQVVLALYDGRSVEEVWAEIVAPASADEPVDPTDVAAAMGRPATREVFAVASDDSRELERVLLQPLSEWRVFLHPVQRKLAYRSKPYGGPVRVCGGPGTGKTVVALHRVKALAETTDQASGGGRPILLTTFTTSLADSLAQLLIDLVGREVADRVDVLNIDKVTSRVLRQFPDSPWATAELVSDAALADRWDAVIRDADSGAGTVDRPFLVGEWEQVILAQNIRTRDQYLAARRSGRGRRLNRMERAAIWDLIEEFERRLEHDRVLGFKQAAARAADLTTGWTDADRPYRHIVVDEAQDLHGAHWATLRALVPAGPNDLFIVGDTFQRVYDNRVTLGQLGVDIRGRSHRLTLNYRTTRQILAAALRLFDTRGYDDLDGGVEDLGGYRSVLCGGTPEFVGYPSADAELAALVDRVRRWHDAGIPLAEIGVISRTSTPAERAATALRQAGIPAFLVRSGKPATWREVPCMTMHRAKGLEFRAVAVIGVNGGHVPLDAATTPADDDRLQHGRDIQRERSLLLVSATRAREELAVSWCGRPSPFLPPDLRADNDDNDETSSSPPGGSN